jgi:VCBS repeat-containing protein
MTVEVGLTTNNDIDGILWGWAWGNGGSLLLDFSFPTGTAEYTDNSYVSITGFSAFTAGQQAAVRTSLDMIESFSGLSFVETTQTFAVLRYAGASAVNYTNDSDVALNTGNHTIGTAEANPPELEYDGDAPFSAPYAQGDSWYSAGLGANPGLGSFDFTAWIMHETGHNLGLKHGHVTQNGHGINFPMLPADHNSYEYSVMTYSQFPGDTGSGDNAPHHPTTYMQNDIAALQYLYGANYGAGSNSGNTVYTWSTATGEAFINGAGEGSAIANFVLMTIWDGGGNDTYDLSNYTTNLSVDLNPGQWVVLDTSPARAQRANLGDNGAGGPTYFARGNIANALLFGGNNASLIENANGGSGNDTLTGNDIGNTLRGNGGNDTVDGKGGTDTAVFTGPRSQYATSPAGPGVQIADQRPGTPDGTDTASNVEFFQFTNRTYTLAEVLNQPPVLSPDPGSPHPLTEIPGATNSGTPDTVSGALSFTDEGGDTHTAAAALFSATWPAGGAIPAGTQAALALAMSADSNPDVPAGLLEWQFSLADSFVDFLAAGETLDAVYGVTVLDQLLNSATRQVTIRFTGTNDTPTVNAAASDFAAIDSDSGAVAFSDPDLNDRPTATIGLQTVAWQDISNDYTSELTAAQIAVFKAALQIAAQAGNTNVGAIDWDYDIVDSLLDFLAVNETITVFSAIVIDDGNGGTVSPSVTVTLYGSNDAPVGAPDSNGTAKNSTVTVAAVAGVLSNDSDPDVHDLDDLFVSHINGAAGNVGTAVAGTYGALTLQADGSYAYAAYKGSLPSKIVAQDTFTYTVADGHGGTDTSTLSFVVFNPGVSYQAGKDTTLIGGNGQDVLDGSAGGNVLLGGNGADVLIGGDDNTMTGGNGPDIFLFRPGFGANMVTDFNAKNDALQFDPSIFTDADDVLSHTTEIGGSAVIDDGGGNTVTLVGVSLADLQSHTADFYFG